MPAGWRATCHRHRRRRGAGRQGWRRRGGSSHVPLGSGRIGRPRSSRIIHVTVALRNPDYTSSVTELTETAVVRRVPAILQERLRVLSRRQPVTVTPGTSLADCIRAIQRTGTGDSVFVCDADGRLTGVLTERDIFGRLIGEGVDLGRPVENLMTTEPRTLALDQT